MWIQSEELRSLLPEGKYVSLARVLEVIRLLEEDSIAIGDQLYSVDLQERNRVEEYEVRSIVIEEEDILFRDEDEEVICTLEELQKGASHLGFRMVFQTAEEGERFLREIQKDLE